jgi:hypothetical protein
MKCDIDGESLLCRRCRCRVSGAHVRRNCGPPAAGLGDMVAAGLSAIGITKERVEAVVGGPCGCDGRQAAMNAAGAWLGMSPGSTAGPTIDPPA